MIPTIAKTFGKDEKELTIKFMSEAIASELQDQKFSTEKELKATEKELDSKNKQEVITWQLQIQNNNLKTC